MNQVYSKKYLVFILSALVGIAAIIFGISQYYVASDTPESESEYGENIVPYVIGPTTPPTVTPPLAPPPTK